MSWRLAESLITLRNQVNAAYPKRSKATDGTIGDLAHQAQGNASDHNPWIKDRNGVGVVTALDITHDPENGVDIDKLSDELIASRDPRIKYIIANGLIAGPYSKWQWLESSGHYSHIHISVNTSNYDANQQWRIEGDNEVMEDKDNNYKRWNRLGVQIRGRSLSRTEFRQAAVGKTWLKAMEVLSDSAEADRNTANAVTGKQAKADNWPGQIKTLRESNTKLSAQLAVQSEDTQKLNALGQALQWAIKRLGIK